MSRLYDTIEPSVIDDDMLNKAVEEQGPKQEAGRIAKQEGIDFGDVSNLRLDFRNILKIDNLWSLNNLTKLQLDNNIIEQVEGLEELVNLIWLDLSFNNIEEIEGLSTLTKLQDLTLFNNRISRIHNMDSLSRLHVLSVGNNNLTNLDNVVYLRQFKQLQTLNLSGNSFCDNDNYKSFIIAHLPSLVYLDFRLIDDISRDSAKEQYKYSIEELEADETMAHTKQEEERLRDEELSKHKAAYVEHLDGVYLFDSLFSDDTDGQKLNLLPGLPEMVDFYREKFVVICQQLFAYGLVEHEKRSEEVNQLLACVQEAKYENRQAATQHVDNFMTYKKKIYQEVSMASDTKTMENVLHTYSDEINNLWDTLMGLELQLVDQLEETMKEFERNMAELVSTFVETVQSLISQTRDLENIHHDRLLEIAINVLEKMVKNELEEELADDVRELFVDKDTVTNSVSSSHDTHLFKIDNREDEIIRRINGWMTSLIDKIHVEEEVQRNRERVTEINHLIDFLRDDLENFESQTMS